MGFDCDSYLLMVPILCSEKIYTLCFRKVLRTSFRIGRYLVHQPTYNCYHAMKRNLKGSILEMRFNCDSYLLMVAIMCREKNLHSLSLKTVTISTITYL